MKQYRFDYIKEWVEKWNPDIPRTAERIEMTPWDILPPWFMPWEYRPAKDHCGEIIEDFEEWYKQRHDFCVELAEEYEREKIQKNTSVPS